MSAGVVPRWSCPPKRVLAAVDFGEASARATAVAGFVAAASGSATEVELRRFVRALTSHPAASVLEPSGPDCVGAGAMRTPSAVLASELKDEGGVLR